MSKNQIPDDCLEDVRNWSLRTGLFASVLFTHTETLTDAHTHTLRHSLRWWWTVSTGLFCAWWTAAIVPCFCFFLHICNFWMGTSWDCSLQRRRIQLCRMKNTQQSVTSSTCNLAAHGEVSRCDCCCFFSGFWWFLSFPLVIFFSLFWLFHFSFSLVSSTDVTSSSKAQPLPLMQFPTGKFSVLAVFATLVCFLLPPL